MKRCTRGSAVVETLVAFPMVWAFVTSILQLTYLEVATLNTKHAAMVAARAAIVVAHDDPKYYGSPPGSLGGRRQAAVDEAVRNVLRPSDEAATPRTTIWGGFAEGSVLRAKVVFDFPCTIPVAATIVCGPRHTMRLTAEAALPNQATPYEYP
jgi:hypothetical protein